ncbi:MAG: hypothetical protein KTR35_03395 [Gammaproteobacteria bacterium]|nr:hypothetical protein [Gammaproteobacteria bacterium]
MRSTLLANDTATPTPKEWVESELLVPELAQAELISAYHEIEGWLEGLDETSANIMHIQRDHDRLRVRYLGLNAVTEYSMEPTTELVSALEHLRIRECNHQAQHHKALPVKVKGLHYRLMGTGTSNNYLLELKRLNNGATIRLLDQCHMSTDQLQQYRSWLQKPSGIVALASSDPLGLEELSLASTIEMTAVDNTLMRIAADSVHGLPRVQQLELHHADTVHRALTMSADVFVLHCVQHYGIDTARIPLSSTKIIQSLVAIDASDAIVQLLSQGYSTTEIALNLHGVVQRYSYRSLCEHCKSIAPLSDDEREWINQFRPRFSENVMAWLDDGAVHQYMHATGCDACNHTGFGSVRAAYEMLALSDDHRTTLLRGDALGLVQQLKQLQNGELILLNEARRGKLSLAEIRRTLRL